MTREGLIQRIEEVKFLKFRKAASVGRGFMRRTLKHTALFKAGMKQHMAAGKAREFKRSYQYKVATPGKVGQYGKARVLGDIAKGDKGRARMIKHGVALAPAVGAGIVLTAAGIRGVRTYVKYRKKQKERTQFRNIAVYPEHGHAAVGIQPYNQSFYNAPVRSGPPAHQRAMIGGIYEREQVINDIVEAVFRA